MSTMLTEHFLAESDLYGVKFTDDVVDFLMHPEKYNTDQAIRILAEWEKMLQRSYGDIRIIPAIGPGQTALAIVDHQRILMRFAVSESGEIDVRDVNIPDEDYLK